MVPETHRPGSLPQQQALVKSNRQRIKAAVTPMPARRTLFLPWRAAFQRSPARVNGTLSGATAPPEMMKLMAWSTVQSVGVSSSTGTISR